ncbi:thioredoxin family protein [Luteibacter yeojuensis]|uniref:Thioredoxin domain-containing protein n=1 Tax=Luteibacter yeojuensis TaxID=345309 RepID=A0A0F3KRK4_9GAMM|nr:thioredoxin domain-containing protein [Luteibacter yeojuensis]KJV33853.1 hypothetical protein VI08_10880 [Luteibacter yeojuensis]
MATLSTFDDTNFSCEVLKSDIPVVVLFTSAWCGPGRQMLPVMVELCEAFADQVKVGTLDTDNAPDTVATYKITTLPTLCVFEKAVIKRGTWAGTRSGFLSREQVVDMITPLLRDDSQ